MATMNKVNIFVEDLYKATHDFTPSTGHTFKVAFHAATNAPTASSTVLSGLTQATTNADSVSLTVSTCSQTGGTLTMLWADKTVTATSGGIGPFRYVSIYNDTTTVKTDPVVCYYDYGSEITIAVGETFAFDWTTSSQTLT